MPRRRRRPVSRARRAGRVRSAVPRRYGRARLIRLTSKPRIVADPVAAARATGLHHVTDAAPGIRRVRVGRGFRYVSPTGRSVRDPAVLRRIRALVIPPAWSDVWICPHPDGHLQATGRDARGRKQYRYHPRWRTIRDETKFSRMILFAETLPRIRRGVEADLARPGLPREKVLATVARLLERTLIRVGNEEYAQQNNSFGLTTLRGQHVRVNGRRVRFRFRGKGGKRLIVDLADARLAGIVARCRDLPGQELFQYRSDDGAPRAVGSADVNAYLREISGEDFTAKDFRTWAGTVFTAVALAASADCKTETEAKRNVVRAIEQTAERLANTPAICRKCYVHPAIVKAYLDGETIRTPGTHPAPEGLSEDEAAVLTLLRRRGVKEMERAAS